LISGKVPLTQLPSLDYAPAIHSHNDLYYDKSNIDNKVININTDIANVNQRMEYKVDLVNGKVKAEQLPELNYLPLTGGNISGNVTVNGDITGTRVFGAYYNDYAELFKKYDKKIDYIQGYLISIREDSYKYHYSTKEDSTLLVGVVSDTYGHLLGGEKKLTIVENLKKYIPVALAGRVNVYVKGKAKKGDLITSSNLSGIAKVSTLLKQGSIIGKALENKDTEEIGLLKILVMNN